MIALLIIFGILLYVFIASVVYNVTVEKIQEDAILLAMLFPITVPVALMIVLGQKVADILKTVKIERK